MPYTFYGSTSTIHFGEHFRDCQYSLVSFLFAVLLTVPPTLYQPFAKVGASTPPRCPMESAPLFDTAGQIMTKSEPAETILKSKILCIPVQEVFHLASTQPKTSSLLCFRPQNHSLCNLKNIQRTQNLFTLKNNQFR